MSCHDDHNYKLTPQPEGSIKIQIIIELKTRENKTPIIPVNSSNKTSFQCLFFNISVNSFFQ